MDHRWLAVAQGVYYVLTGLWPLVHMRSFLAVTGPKTDLWLVHMVGALAAAIGAALLASAGRGGGGAAGCGAGDRIGGGVRRG